MADGKIIEKQMFSIKNFKRKKMNTEENKTEDPTLQNGLATENLETETELNDKEADEVLAEADSVIDLAAKVHSELESMKDRFLRLNAEFDNYKRRTLKERMDMLKTANSDVMLALLPVLDDFERAISALSADKNNPAFEGVNLIHNKLKSILEQKGLKAMDAIGKPFNVDLHEALTQMPATNNKQKDTVMDVMEKGYFLNDKVIRHAKVVVYN